jgi:hypothetical protein
MEEVDGWDVKGVVAGIARDAAPRFPAPLSFPRLVRRMYQWRIDVPALHRAGRRCLCPLPPGMSSDCSGDVLYSGPRTERLVPSLLNGRRWKQRHDLSPDRRMAQRS